MWHQIINIYYFIYNFISTNFCIEFTNSVPPSLLNRLHIYFKMLFLFKYQQNIFHLFIYKT